MAKRRIKEIENIAQKILEDTSEVLPINPEVIAKHLGIHVVPYQVSDEISGVLVQKGEQATIGYNPNHAPVRKRFTIAHELGHFILGHKRGGMFIDRYDKHFHFSVLFRDPSSSTGEFEQEREANAFAAALLMPAKIVIEKFSTHHFDLTDDDGDVIQQLAKEFKVSNQAMSYRLANLGLLSPF